MNQSNVNRIFDILCFYYLGSNSNNQQRNIEAVPKSGG